MATNSSGTIVGEQRYYPFGETRFTTGTMFTDKLFTGQREMAGLGIYHYNARFYSPKLGRFLSTDTIVPGHANPQNLNRFSYVRNNPLKYIDPSGHVACRARDECTDMGVTPGYGLPRPPRPPSNGGGGGGNGGRGDSSTPTSTPIYTSVPIATSTPAPAPLVAATFTSTSTYTTTTTQIICPTPTPGRPPCWVDPNHDGPPAPYYPLGWDESLVPWDEVALDAGGMLGDVIPLLQVPATIAEGAKNVNNVLNVAELYLDTWDIVDAGGSLENIDGINVILDFASFVPEFGFGPSAIGLVYNLGQGIVINEYSP